ncbi:MAG: AAA family ATPase [Chloroflexi bacterium]|nr:AAA family ATPase [Chloroflexota bacterium]
MDLFAQAQEERSRREAPLAARMRPRTLDEYVGQEHVIGPGRLLRRAIQADQLSSLIFYGPPGTGKTTLAMVIANTTQSRFVSLNAVLAGVKDVRDVVQEAQEARNLYGRRTILFVDEVHRWNKAQQDALLPWVENGTIIMIGATIENPWFSVNRALLSRSRVFQLVPLSEEELRTIALRALADPERGYGARKVRVEPDALDHLVDVANGDARSLLNALELAVETTEPDEQGVIVVDMAVAEESIQQRAVLYDREGDYHFDTISAFIKSLRGSDPDAALYWLAKMIYAGEDPRFIFRRMLILASEDVGLADPQALVVVQAAADAFERVGLPEGQFHLAQAALYLATTHKSNSTLGYFDALTAVREERDSEVPTHLKDASRDKEGFGHGQGYLYPHAYRDHWVAQQYLPDALQGKVFYRPGDQGYERQIKAQVARRREEQLAAMVEAGPAASEVLTYTPELRSHDRWLMRAVSTAARGLGELRDRVLDGARLTRHAVVLDLSAGTGLLTWEALRRAPEGGVWALAQNEADAEALRQQASSLPEVERPVILCGTLDGLPQQVAAYDPRLRFDAIVGRRVLVRAADKAAALRLLRELLAEGGRISLAEPIPRRAQRLYELVDTSSLPKAWADAWRAAEEAIYANPQDPLVNWDLEDLRLACQQAGLQLYELHLVPSESEYLFGQRHIAEWFAPARGGRPSYVDHLSSALPAQALADIRRLLERQLVGQTRPWRSVIAYLVAGRAPDSPALTQ